MKKLKYLIVGTGRCGSVFVSKFLTSIGIVCGHETIFDHNGLFMAKQRLLGNVKLETSIVSKINVKPDSTFEPNGWNPNLDEMQADSSYMAAPFLNDEILCETKILHVVRHPVKVINSFCNYLYYFKNDSQEEMNLYEKFIFKHLNVNEFEKLPQYDKAAIYYINWNRMIENSNPDLFFKIEDISELKNYFSVTDNQEIFNDEKSNTFYKHASKSFNFLDIKSKQIRSELLEMSKKYGYYIDKELAFV